MDTIGLFALSVIILMIGHLIRAARWTLLLGAEYRRDLRACFMALSLGYVFNAFLPFRAGEFVRALYGAVRTKSKFTDMLASIVVERAYDLVAVALLVALLAHFRLIDAAAMGIAIASGISATVIIGGFILTARVAAARRVLWHIANIFNPRIRFVLLDTAMRSVEINGSARFFIVKFALQSLAMWGAYLLSYLALGAAVQMDVASILGFFYAHPLKPIALEVLEKSRAAAVYIAIYATVPCLLALAFERMKNLSWPRLSTALNLLSDPGLQMSRKSDSKFSDSDQYDAYLCRHFSGDGSLASDFETYAIQDATVVRRMDGSSGAITAVVQVGSDMRIRKYAANGASAKLAEQFAWIGHYQSDLPVVRTLGSTAMEGRFFYDMPYSISARDFYDFIHMSQSAPAWDILADILETVAQFHGAHPLETASDDTVARYVRDKVEANFAQAKQAFPQAFEGDMLRVNGKEVDLRRVERFCRTDFLLPRLALRQQAAIHGDLTIENVIYDPALSRKWMLIDPNTPNIFESPLLDYAKLFQSLHLGYEPLSRNNSCHFSSDGISFFMPRTIAYDELYEKLCGEVTQKLGAEALREIRLHEIVHYLRLIPYKLRKSPHAGLLFTGCLCLLIDSYFEEFEK